MCRGVHFLAEMVTGALFFATPWGLLLAPTLFVRWDWSADGHFEQR